MPPAELRNHIYEEVAKHDKALLTKDRTGILVYLTSSLCQTNRQISEEYRPVLTTTATSIYSIVTDFNFDNIILWETQKHTKCRHIGIRLTHSAKSEKSLLNLIRWINYQNEMTSPLTMDAYYFPHRAKSTKLGTRFYNKRLQRVEKQHLSVVIEHRCKPETTLVAKSGVAHWELYRVFESLQCYEFKAHPSW
jgi:hypothetical protein